MAHVFFFQAVPESYYFDSSFLTIMTWKRQGRRTLCLWLCPAAQCSRHGASPTHPDTDPKNKLQGRIILPPHIGSTHWICVGFANCKRDPTHQSPSPVVRTELIVLIHFNTFRTRQNSSSSASSSLTVLAIHAPVSPLHQLHHGLFVIYWDIHSSYTCNTEKRRWKVGNLLKSHCTYH